MQPPTPRHTRPNHLCLRKLSFFARRWSRVSTRTPRPTRIIRPRGGRSARGGFRCIARLRHRMPLDGDWRNVNSSHSCCNNVLDEKWVWMDFDPSARVNCMRIVHSQTTRALHKIGERRRHTLSLRISRRIYRIRSPCAKTSPHFSARDEARVSVHRAPFVGIKVE